MHYFDRCGNIQKLSGEFTSDRGFPGVAKFGIALEWGSRGPEFESQHSDQIMIIRTTLSKWVVCSDLSFLLKMFFDSSRVAQFSAALDLFPKFCYIFYITEFEFLSIKITFEVIAVKRFAILLNFLLLIWLCGCSASPVIETLNNWSFQHNEGTNDYSVFLN